MFKQAVKTEGSRCSHLYFFMPWWAQIARQFRYTWEIHLHSSSSFLHIIAVPAPSNLSFKEVTADSMKVTWNSPQVPIPSDINRYIVRYHPVDDEDDTVEHIVKGYINYVILQST